MRTHPRRALPVALAAFALAGFARAQGSDSCAAPTLIAGEGTFPFSTSSATTGSQGQFNCSGSFGIDRDVWFAWVAPASGGATLSLCGGASFDTKVAAYDGAACPAGSPLGCNDDSCGLQSVITFPVTIGNSYVLQIGSWPSSVGGAGSFSLTVGLLPPQCGSGVGPDVIVGDLNSVMNVTAVGGYDAIAIGTTSCNVGSAVVNWVANTNDHPVIRQNVYRYKEVNGASRFEQVGMSWVKHGFGAAQDSFCCTCQAGGDGMHLGVGCSDPYDASTNGAQSILGPNWQVNAHTGFFTYPPANPSHGSDAIYRRCKMAATDLEATGGGNTTKFFGEGHYVTKDDATAGNQNNNVSYRAMTVSGGPTNFTFALSGSTQEGAPAIRAWATVDPGVHIEDMQIAGDGLIVMGTRATDLGGGQWRYEYSVYNMNANRAVGSFSVPVPAGVTVTNVGFHDVDYHDGDGPGSVNYSGLDWTSSSAGGAMTWSTETEAQNASANALRWGTLYSFRFDADAAPATGTITLGLWRAGSPPSITGSGDVPGGGGGGSSITSFCFGDGSGAACPCGNFGTVGHGCDNSIFTGGALLAAGGAPSLGADTLVLNSSDERPTALTVFWQGANETAGTSFGDGVACFSNPGLRRLYSRNAVGGVASAPQGADLSVSARSAATGDTLSPGDTRIYHTFYRDPDPSFCPTPAGDTFNSSNGLRVVWGP
jgi:hypothetical protein